MALMARADAAALAGLAPLLRQLRTLPGLAEKQPGVFHLLGQAFVHFHDDDGRLSADLKKASGSGFDRFAVDTPPAQRKFIDEAQRRAAKLADD